MPAWTAAFPLSDVPPGGAKLFRDGKDKVAVFRLDDGLFAIDDRCPHEGWPLAQGTVKGTVVTCAWHNYKFDLRDGQCVLGEERARTFGVRVVEGIVEVDLQPQDPSEVLLALWGSLDVGLQEGRMGRAVRDVVRLLQFEVSPRAIALRVARHDALYGEYGPTHGLAVSIDALRYLRWFDGLEAAVPIANALDVVADGTKRRSPRPRPEPSAVEGVPEEAEAQLRVLVESEDGRSAEALLRGMLAQGWALDRLERVFLRMCADHFLSFGHRLIYTIKTFDLLRDTDDPDAADDLLPALLHGIVNSTREDMLPRWRGVRDRIEALETDLDLVYAHCRDQAVSMDPRWVSRLHEALTDAPEEKALYMLEHSMRAGVPFGEIVDALSAAAAQRMLRFDSAKDADPGIQDDWLSVTHGQTTVHALRAAVPRLPEPTLLRMFLLIGRFVHRTRALDLSPEARWTAPVEDSEASEAADVLEAIARNDERAALDATWAALKDEGARDALREGLHRWAMSDALTAPIVVAHAIKTVVAAWDEYDATDDPAHILGVVRFAACAPRQRRIGQRAAEAIAFVSEGKIPRTLAQ
jgi:nitrite reductase/ring-hydroxylating ferredoxin subunit